MPKLDPAYQGRIELPDISSDDESSTKPVSAKRSDKRSALTQIGNDSETERVSCVTLMLKHTSAFIMLFIFWLRKIIYSC